VDIEGTSQPHFRSTLSLVLITHVALLFLLFKFLNEKPPQKKLTQPKNQPSLADVSWHDPQWFTTAVQQRIRKSSPQLVSTHKPLPFSDSANPDKDPESRIALPIRPPEPKPKATPKPKPKPAPKKATKPKPEKIPQKTVSPKPKPTPKKATKPKPKTISKPKPKPAPKKTTKPKPEKVPKKTVSPKPKPAPKKAAKPKPKPTPKPKPAPKKATKPKPKVTPKPELAQKSEVTTKPVAVPKAKVVPKPTPAPTPTADKEEDTSWYDELVYRTFNNQWQKPQQLFIGGSAPITTKLKIVVNPDGTIASTKIVRPSGNPEMDRSVIDATRAVGKISQPLPAALARSGYEITVNFQLK